MVKILIFDKVRLVNDQHFAFMKSFVKHLNAIEDAPEKLQTVIAAMKVAFDEENRVMKQAQGSDLTEVITKADAERDNAYRKLRDMVKLWEGMALEPQKSAATAIAKVLKTNKIDTEAQLNAESGALDNLLEDLAKEAMAKNVEAIGAKEIVAVMTEANETVQDMMTQRNHDTQTKLTGAVRRARQQSDKAYAATVEMVEACNLVLGGLDRFMGDWNTEVKYYIDALNRKNGTGGGSKPSGGGSGSGSGDGSGSGSGSTGGSGGEGSGSEGSGGEGSGGEGSGSEGGDDSGSGTEPDLPTIGGEPGDGGGSGGDTGGDSFEE